MSPGIRIAAAWSIRILVVAAVVVIIGVLVVQLSGVVVPLLIAVLLGALLIPLRNALERLRAPRWASVPLTLLVFFAAIGGLITLVVLQARSGFPGLREQAVGSARELDRWLATGPLHLSDVEISRWIDSGLSELQSQSARLAAGALTVGIDIGHIMVGTLLVLFTLLFLLIGGRGVWTWLLHLLPRAARPAADEAALAGWHTLSLFVRAQLAVAAVNGIGIGIGAAILQLPLALPIAVLVFLGSFIPFVGAIATGAVAFVLALITGGWVVALVMLAIVVGVHLLEAHVLQPLVLGSAVSVHPLAVILGVAAGLESAGIAGALFAVPVMATVNTVVTTIARRR